MMLWTDKTAGEATQGQVLTGAIGSWSATRVIIDSRKAQKGDLLVALKGENHDGHNFVADALGKGASAAIVSKKMDGNCFLVSDTQKALEDLARYARARSSAAVVGVTGSVGKTSTKEMVRLALAAHGETFATAGNYNNHIGTPLTLANLPPSAKFAVFEMGMNHANEISPLSKMVKPLVSVITTIEAVHMEFFASIDAIADAKAEIFDGMQAGGTAVLNNDNACFERLKKAALAKGLKVVSCGEKGDCRIGEYRATASGSEVKAIIHGKEISFTIGAVGKHWAMTSLFTLAVAASLNLDLEKTAKALAHFSEPEGRGRVSRMAGGYLLIDDSYNASPASMRAAFAKTAEVWEGAGRKGRKLAALGDMLELGPETIAFHTGLAEDLQRNAFDGVYTAGESMKYLYDALPSSMQRTHVAKADALFAVLNRELKKDDILLVKGSHSSKMHALAKSLAAPAQEAKHAV